MRPTAGPVTASLKHPSGKLTEQRPNPGAPAAGANSFTEGQAQDSTGGNYRRRFAAVMAARQREMMHVLSSVLKRSSTRRGLAFQERDRPRTAYHAPEDGGLINCTWD